MPDEFNLTPDPRILPMLGEINLSQWQCVAEFIDNSVDAFLDVVQAGGTLSHPEILVQIPTMGQADAHLTVVDNGPGMTVEKLEKAVKAGWTSHDPISSLGLFGMGFNIATARLGTVTEVWTTRAEDLEWVGLRIDFDALKRQGNFRTPRLTRPKVERGVHGTEIRIQGLKTEQREWFSKNSNRSKLSKELGRLYSAMLRSNGQPITFSLQVNGRPVQGRQHCVWGDGDESRTVETTQFGIVDAFQRIDVALSPRPFDVDTWQWLTNDPAVLAAHPGHVLRPRRIRGWVGIQRYLHGTEFGIDFLRNGRKVELANKDLFTWNAGESEEIEYPTDDPRNRGRIVGELHLDHCRVTYMKDRFERTDPAWEEMTKVIRGEGPLRPEKARQGGFGPNNSPLFKLFQLFRRSSPKPKVAGCYKRLLIVPDNDKATAYADHFYRGDVEYQSDAKWWELVEEADFQLLVAPTVGSQPSGSNDDLLGELQNPATPSDTQGASVPPALPPRTPIHSLSGEYRHDPSEQRWDIRAYDVAASDPGLGNRGNPWILIGTAAGYFDFLVNTGHRVFRSATLTPLDALLAELAWSAMDFNRGHHRDGTFAQILAELRDRYAKTTELDPVALGNEARQMFGRIARTFAANMPPDDAQSFFDELTSNESEDVQQQMVARRIPNPQAIILDGRFLEYARFNVILKFVSNHPELFFDGNFWDDDYERLDFASADVTLEARRSLLKQYEGLLLDALWLAEEDPENLSMASRERLLRGALAVELLSPGREELQAAQA